MTKHVNHKGLVIKSYVLDNVRTKSSLQLA